MILFPQPDPTLLVPAVVTAFAAGILVGFGVYRGLKPLEQHGRIVTLFVRWWSWWLALVAGMIALVGIAGPYVFAGPTRGGGYDSSPITRDEIVWICAIQALAYSLASIWQDAGPRRRATARVRAAVARGEDPDPVDLALAAGEPLVAAQPSSCRVRRSGHS